MEKDKYDEVARIAREGRGTAIDDTEYRVRYYNSRESDKDFARMPKAMRKKFAQFRLDLKTVKERRLGSRGGASNKHRKRLMRYRIAIGWSKAKDNHSNERRKKIRANALQMTGNVCAICQREVVHKRAMLLCVDPQTEHFREYVAMICKSCSMRWTPLQIANTKNFENVREHVQLFSDKEIKNWARYKLHTLPFERAQRLAKWLLSLTVLVTSPRVNPLDNASRQRRKRKLQGICKHLIGSHQETTLHG